MALRVFGTDLEKNEKEREREKECTLPLSCYTRASTAARGTSGPHIQGRTINFA